MQRHKGSARRYFLKSAAAATSALGVPTFIPAGVLGRDGTPSANERIVLGAIGLGGRCNQLIDQIPDGAKLVAAADCYRQRAVHSARRRNAKWAVYRDYREMFSFCFTKLRSTPGKSKTRRHLTEARGDSRDI